MQYAIYMIRFGHIEASANMKKGHLKLSSQIKNEKEHRRIKELKWPHKMNHPSYYGNLRTRREREKDIHWDFYWIQWIEREFWKLPEPTNKWESDTSDFISIVLRA